jgi:pyrrolidone-carboxylate peptidase
MRLSDMQQALTPAAGSKVTPTQIDALMLKVRDEGGVDDTERKALVKVADSFDDDTKQRLMQHLAATVQKKAWVNVETDGTLAKIEGRYATLSLGVRGLTARVGLFDNAFTVKGQAKTDGTLKLVLDGQSVEVAVKKGDRPAAILANVKAALPSTITGLVYGGDVDPVAPALFEGRDATSNDAAAHLMLYKPEALHLKEGEKPMRVVVTGYGKFMGITDNPSGNMAKTLSELGVKGGIVEYHRLDVTPAAVDAFMAQMKAHPPDVILSMGVTGGQSQLEELPENHLGAAPDGNDVMMDDRVISPGGPQEVATDFPVETVDWALKRFGKNRQTFTSLSDARYSADRSAYLCNYIGYNLALTFGDKPDTTAGFIHVTDRTPANQMHAILEAVVAKQLDSRRNPTPAS